MERSAWASLGVGNGGFGRVGKERKNEHKPKLLGPDIFRWVGGLRLFHVKGWGPKSSVGYPAIFFGLSRRRQKNLRRKLVFNFWPPVWQFTRTQDFQNQGFCNHEDLSVFVSDIKCPQNPGRQPPPPQVGS